MSGLSGEHPLRKSFEDALWVSLEKRLEVPHPMSLVEYLTDLLIRFLSLDGVYAVRGADGKPARSVSEMLTEGDVRLRAESFDRERSVHRHIGDYLLFCSGLFPEILNNSVEDRLLDPIQQGRQSYFVVSTFDYGKYAPEAPTFRRLSEEFEACRLGLRMLRTDLRLG